SPRRVRTRKNWPRASRRLRPMRPARPRAKPPPRRRPPSSGYSITGSRSFRPNRRRPAHHERGGVLLHDVRAQLAAGRRDLLAALDPDGGVDALRLQLTLEGAHPVSTRRPQAGAGGGVVWDQVHVRLDAADAGGEGARLLG